jgi:hypothetical protein
MAKTIFLLGTRDCQWLRETHLTGLELPEFMSFELHGNEDCPDKLLLYESIMPMYTTPPIAVYVRKDDNTSQAHEDPASFANVDIHAPKAPGSQQT